MRYAVRAHQIGAGFCDLGIIDDARSFPVSMEWHRFFFLKWHFFGASFVVLGDVFIMCLYYL